MECRLVSDFIDRLVEEKCPNCTELWTRVKKLLEEEVCTIYRLILRCEEPNEVILVADPDYAEKEIGPIALLNVSGITRGGIIYILPREDRETLLHELLHFLFNDTVLRDIPQFTSLTRAVLLGRFGIDVDEELLRFVIETEAPVLQEVVAYSLERMLVGTGMIGAQNHVATLACRLVSDLNLNIHPEELARQLLATYEAYIAQHYLPDARHCIDAETLLALPGYVGLHSLITFIQYLKEGNCDLAKNALENLYRQLIEFFVSLRRF